MSTAVKHSCRTDKSLPEADPESATDEHPPHRPVGHEIDAFSWLVAGGPHPDVDCVHWLEHAVCS